MAKRLYARAGMSNKALLLALLHRPEKNPGRKRAFGIRIVMTALIDADHKPLERWNDMRDADTVIV